jgi:hypothetical protein
VVTALAAGLAASTIGVTTLLVVGAYSPWSGFVVITDGCLVACAIGALHERAVRPRDEIRIHAR